MTNKPKVSLDDLDIPDTTAAFVDANPDPADWDDHDFASPGAIDYLEALAALDDQPGTPPTPSQLAWDAAYKAACDEAVRKGLPPPLPQL